MGVRYAGCRLNVFHLHPIQPLLAIAYLPDATVTCMTFASRHEGGKATPSPTQRDFDANANDMNVNTKDSCGDTSIINVPSILSMTPTLE